MTSKIEDNLINSMSTSDPRPTFVDIHEEISIFYETKMFSKTVQQRLIATELNRRQKTRLLKKYGG